MRPALLYSILYYIAYILYTQSVVGFSVIPKGMTLNDTERLFPVNFCFRAGLAGSDRATFEK